MTTLTSTLSRSGTVLAVGLALALGGCSSPNELPTVSITAPSEAEVHGPEIAFQADASDPDGEIAAYQWTFGDDATSDEANPIHTYQQSGEYRVELTVTDDSNATATDGITIQVEIGPQARASIHDSSNENDVLFQYMSGRAPLAIAFDGARSSATSGTELVSYEWDFGDGASATGVRTSHTYTEAGRHQATLTVTDSEGQTDSAEVVVEVSPNEAATGSVRLGDTAVSYEQVGPEQSRNSARGTSLFYKHVVESPRALTADEIATVLRDILDRIQRQTDADWINVQLYDAVRTSFMAPRDYAHYLGALTWDGSISEGDPIAVNVNTAYLNDDAVRVLGADVQVEDVRSVDGKCGDLCARFRMARASLYIQDEPICRQDVVNTVRELASWQLSGSHQGHLITIYSRDVREPIGHAIGARAEGGPSLSEIPLELFQNPPESWDLQEPTLWLKLDDDVPEC